MKANKKSEALEWFKAIIVALILVYFIKLLFFDVLTIDGVSMEPTLHNGERVFVNILSCKIKKPGRFDLVIFTPSIERDSLYIKRAIGFPGDTVKITGGKVYVNNTRLNESYLSPNTYTEAETEPFIIHVPEGSIFVLGDNRECSEDSRDSTLGPIPLKSIRGIAEYRIFPLDQMCKLLPDTSDLK